MGARFVHAPKFVTKRLSMGVTKIQEFFVKCIIENGTKSGPGIVIQ